MKSRPPMSLSARPGHLREISTSIFNVWISQAPRERTSNISSSLPLFSLLFFTLFLTAIFEYKSTTAAGTYYPQIAQHPGHVINTLIHASCCFFRTHRLATPASAHASSWRSCRKDLGPALLTINEALQFRWALHLATFGFSLAWCFFY